MTSKKTGRLLIPENQIIVVLDTAPARELAYAEEAPLWVETFAQMARKGYSFSLADGAHAELLAQRQRNALSALQFGKIFERLRRFINPELPVLPGKRDLAGMLQISKRPWSEHECLALSQGAWEKLRRCTDPEDQQESPEWALQEERDDWVSFFEGWQKIVDELIDGIKADNLSEESIDQDENGPSEEQTDASFKLLVEEILKKNTEIILKQIEVDQDKRSSLTPPMSVRSHLKNRYLWRQFIRMQKSKNAYDPESYKKRNDGIDADLYPFLILPALVVTKDGGFFNGLSDIDSFQKGWFFDPQLLANAWMQGANPAPTWP